MERQLRRRFWAEAVLAVVTGLLAVVTVMSREWIEVLLRVDPDGGSGELEWMVVAALACVTMAAGAVARMEFQRTAGATGLR